MMLKLDKVSRGPHLPTLVATSIAREIAQGRLKPGDQLPSEQTLAQTFAVSRNVVREAIARLRSEGRIWSQQGRGAFVAEMPTANSITIDNEALQQAEALANLFELRGILEGEAAALAAVRRTPDEMSAIRDSIVRMVAEPDGSVAQMRTDLEFHRMIAAATHNAYLIEFLVFVSARVGESIQLAGSWHRSEDMTTATMTEHERIAVALEAGDPQAARSAMRAHLAGAAQRVGLLSISPIGSPPIDPDGKYASALAVSKT
ncbi:MAG: FadR/GntR family transcriptional regulator [Ancalomicrobiaceae bacterium]|nr:FadR/GntR family transcriptional regulator [Ancalomicrobiaceae bacterium]